MEVMGAQQLSDYQYCNKNILFCIQQQKESHTGLEQQQHFHFWENYSSKAA